MPITSNAYNLDTTDGWDGAELGAANINYYVVWSGAPDGNNGLDNAGKLNLATIVTELENAMASWSTVVDVTFTSLGNAVSTPGLKDDPWGTVDNPTLVFYFHEVKQLTIPNSMQRGLSQYSHMLGALPALPPYSRSGRSPVTFTQMLKRTG